MRGYYTVAHVCRMFNVSRTTIERWEIGQSFPKRVRFSGHPRGRCGFPIDEVDDWDRVRRTARDEVPERQHPST